MKKRFAAAIVAASVSILLSGCSSDESPSELDLLIEQLQTVQLTSETTPEEAPEEAESESENTEAPVTDEGTEETSEETSDSENTEPSSENTTPTENTEETTDTTEENEGNPVEYKSLTVTVVSVEEDHITVELDGVVYKAFIDENTGIFGGDILEGKTVTITYVLSDGDSQADISAAAITVLP